MPKRAVWFLLFLLASMQATAEESAEAAKVAAWVKSLPPVEADASHFGVIGGVSAGQIERFATDFVKQNGPAALFADAQALASAKQGIDQRATNLVVPLTAGGISWYRDVQNVPWGLTETSRGAIHWDLLDHVTARVAAAGGRYVGTIAPYAAWELEAAGYARTSEAMCLRLFDEDFFYLKRDGRMDRLKDLAAWESFVLQAVERYDGDGSLDAPAIGAGVKYWQIHNEPEGDRCGNYRGNAAAFVELMRRGWNAVHAACSDCVVLNGGAGIPLWRENQIAGGTFWREFAEAGGAQYVDVIAAHYNDGKIDGGNVENFETQVTRLRELLGDKPVWLTEFGVFVDQGGQFSALPEAEAGAWYVRFYAAGLAAGVTRFFPDSAAFVTYPAGRVQLPFYVNKLMEAKLGGFTDAEKLAPGQYRFRVGASDRYVVWSGIPAGVTGSVLACDMYGNQAIVDASTLTPSETNPLILVPQPGRARPARR